MKKRVVFGILYNDMSAKISVIIPVYNVEAYLAECLDSVLAQTYGNLEILAVNDGSKDSSPDILRKYAARDSRITVLDKPNGGLSDARNFGIAHATGDWYLFVDSDDLIAPDTAEVLLKTAEENAADIAVCDMEYFYEDGRRTYSSGGDFTCTDIRKTPQLIAVNNSACNKLFRASLFAEERCPVGKFYEDLWLIPCLLYDAERSAHCAKPLYYYRQRSGSIAHSADPRIFDIYDALDHVRDHVRAKGAEKTVLDEIRHLYVVHGLDLTTLRIREFDDKTLREDYLRKNMERLRASCPDYTEDAGYRNAPLKKKLIYLLLKLGMYKTVLRIYDR